MRGLVRPLVAVLAIAGATWFVALHALPRVVMRVAMSRIRGATLAEARAASDPVAPSASTPGAAPSAASRRIEPSLAATILERDGWNVALAAPPTTSDSRTIVRPSPDLLSVACVYDLSKGPVLVRAPRTPTYLSLSAFADDTDNFVAVNDRAPGTEGPALLLVPPGDTRPAPASAAGATRVESPSLRGIALARVRVDHPDRLRELVALQRQVTCEPVR
ncbi:MAG: DUF1254 domain-containing protein [Alphaproteobacteria bacterium]